MPAYELCFKDGHGQLLRKEEAVALSDSDAMQEARERDHAHCVEVRHGPRLVGTVHPRHADEG